MRSAAWAPAEAAFRDQPLVYPYEIAYLRARVVATIVLVLTRSMYYYSHYQATSRFIWDRYHATI
jgi:hypothetical protein